MTPEEETEMRSLLVAAIKELGEIAECIIKDDPRPDHWKNELCDLCGLVICPMLDVACIKFSDAVRAGRTRRRDKIREDHAQRIREIL